MCRFSREIAWFLWGFLFVIVIFSTSGDANAQEIHFDVKLTAKWDLIVDEDGLNAPTSFRSRIWYNDQLLESTPTVRGDQRSFTMNLRLKNNDRLELQVRGCNSVGCGEWSDPSVVIYKAPKQPGVPHKVHTLELEIQ